MDIRGAIFDCDGTILDSMPMWFDVFPDWLASHGVPDAREVCDRCEHMDFEEECFYLSDEFGFGLTHEEALAEVRARVVEGYETQVAPFAGVRDFLEELRGAGVPMAILSSTSAPLVTAQIARHGLDGYFDHVCYTGDVGFDKQHRGAYDAVREMLGTPLEATWVFEDAPFGVATAHGAGYPTVALLNDHDGRDEGFLRAHCDILAHGWPELSCALLEDYARPVEGPAGADPLEVLVVGGSPEPSSPALVARLAAEADYVIAADRGAAVLREAGVVPDVFCGDGDSAPAGDAAWARQVAARTIAFPRDKYALDLTIALDAARHEAARRGRPLAVMCTCVSGGRPDHALGVLGCLLACLDAAPTVVEDAPVAFECRLLAPEGATTWELGAEAVGRTFSAVALSEVATLSEAGMQWEVTRAEFPLLADKGYSNVVTSEAARVTCHTGTLACYLLG